MRQSPRNLLQFFARSDNRIIVLEAIATRASFTQAEIQADTEIPRSTISRILEDFLTTGLLSRVDHGYKVTPLGGFLAERLDSITEVIEVTQQLHRLLKRLSDSKRKVANSDRTSSEIVSPVSSDPRAPTRRFTDLLQRASDVQLLVPTIVPMMFDLDVAMRAERRTFEVVLPQNALEVNRDNSTSPLRLREQVASSSARVFVYDGDIPHFVGMIDEFAIVGLIDDSGTINGYVETRDEALRAWTETTFGVFRRNADRASI